MPLNLVDPTVQPVGAGIPNSPLASMFGKAVGAYGATFPSALDRAQINYHNAETQRLQQQMGAGSQIAQTVARALAANNPTATQDPVTPANNGMGPVPPPELNVTTPVTHPGMSTGDAARAALPGLIQGAADSGDVGKANALALLMSSYMKGTPTDIAGQRPGEPTTEDMAMMGAGHPYAATPGGVLQERTLGTPEMRNRNFKIQQIMQSQGASEQQAAAIVDGVVEGGLDPVTRQPYIVNKLDLMRQGQGGGAPAAPAPAPAAPAAPGASNFDNAVNFVMGKEGGYVSNDGGKGPTNFGINQESNPDIDVSKLTPDAAKSLYQSRYWNAIGGDKLPPALATVALDAAVNQGVGPAKAMLAASGGDPMRMIQLRAQAYQNIVAQNPAKAQFLPVWMKRLDDLKAQIGVAQPANGAAAPAAAAPAKQVLRAGPDDFTLDTSQGYGGGGVINSLGSQAAAMVDSGSTDSAKLASDQISNFKKDLLDLERARSGGRQSDKGNALITDALPHTGAIDSLEDVWKRATTGAGTAKDEGVTALNTVLEKRAQDQSIIDDQKNMPPDLVKNAYAAVKFEDGIINKYGSEALKDQYNRQYYGKSVAPASAPEASNLEKGKALTTPSAYKNVNDVVQAAKAGTLTRAQAKQILSSQFGVQ